MSPERKLLTKARALIDSGAETYICLALEAVCSTPTESEVVNDLIELIHEGLRPLTNPCAALEDWCEVAHAHAITYQHARLARLAWIDKLLEAYRE